MKLYFVTGYDGVGRGPGHQQSGWFFADSRDHAADQFTDAFRDFPEDYEIYECPYTASVPGRFRVDTDNSDDTYFYVDVKGKGSVVIKNEDEGIVVDIYPFHVVDEPVATTWAHMSDLTEEK